MIWDFFFCKYQTIFHRGRALSAFRVAKYRAISLQKARWSMEHHGGFQVSSAFLGPVRLQICCSNTNSRSPRPDELGIFLAGIQEKVRMIRCNFSCNWAGTIWIRIWKGLNKQMVDVIYSNSFFFAIYISSDSAPGPALSFLETLQIGGSKRGTCWGGDSFLRGLLFGDGLDTNLHCQGWNWNLFQSLVPAQRRTSARERAGQWLMLLLHRTLSIFFSQLILDRSEANLATRSSSRCWTLACRRVL